MNKYIQMDGWVKVVADNKPAPVQKPKPITMPRKPDPISQKKEMDAALLRILTDPVELQKMTASIEAELRRDGVL
ncbi:TPA: hypothetical protein N3288_000219 [Klebsiella aerogenes]|nr:hypothetical protein [Klebsiella aerogenes]